MEKNRTIFIWDIHWCYDEFRLLLNKLNINEQDKIYLSWDMINKWPFSYDVLKYIYDNRWQIKAILWNHELAFIKRFKWEIKNEKPFFEELKNKIWENKDLINYILSLPKFIEEKKFILLHWWKNPDKKIEEHSPEEITKIREINWKWWYDFYKWKKKIIYWHWAVDWLRVRKNTIWLDTGCVYWKSLTAYTLETWEIIQQNALNIYESVYKKKLLIYSLAL